MKKDENLNMTYRGKCHLHDTWDGRRIRGIGEIDILVKENVMSKRLQTQKLSGNRVQNEKNKPKSNWCRERRRNIAQMSKKCFQQSHRSKMFKPKK
jgi:hypothetical protein